MALPFGVACHQAKQLEEMHDTTAEMRDITKEMRDNTKGTDKVPGMMDGMKKKMDRLADVTESRLTTTNQKMDSLPHMQSTMEEMLASTYGLCKTRHALAATVRTDSFKALRESRRVSGKLGLAVQYEMAFEFQHWGICGDDDLARRDQFFDTGLQQFFLDLGATVSRRSIWILEPGDAMGEADYPSALASKHIIQKDGRLAFMAANADNDDMDFNALSAAAHKVDDTQVTVVAVYNRTYEEKISEVSIYSLIREALLAERSQSDAPTENTAVKHWYETVYANRRIAIRMLQARHNFIVGIVIDKLAARAEKNFPLVRNFGLLVNKLDLISRNGFEWKVAIDDFTAGELHEYAKYLRYAIETQTLLRDDLAIPLHIDRELRPFISGLKLVTKAPAIGALATERGEFIKLLTAIKSTIPSASSASAPAASPQKKSGFSWNPADWNPFKKKPSATQASGANSQAPPAAAEPPRAQGEAPPPDEPLPPQTEDGDDEGSSSTPDL